MMAMLSVGESAGSASVSRLRCSRHAYLMRRFTRLRSTACLKWRLLTLTSTRARGPGTLP